MRPFGSFILLSHSDGTYQSRFVPDVKRMEEVFSFLSLLDTEEKAKSFMSLKDGPVSLRALRSNEKSPSPWPEEFRGVLPSFEVSSSRVVRTERGTWNSLYAKRRVGADLDIVFRNNTWHMITALDADEDTLELVPLSEYAQVFEAFSPVFLSFFSEASEKFKQGEDAFNVTFDVTFDENLSPQEISKAYKKFKNWDDLSKKHLRKALLNSPSIRPKAEVFVPFILPDLTKGAFQMIEAFHTRSFMQEMEEEFDIHSKTPSALKKL